MGGAPARAPRSHSPFIPSPPLAPADKKSDLPPVYYTVSSILNLFSFPDLWRDAVWATPQKLIEIRNALRNYIQGCEAYTGGEAPRLAPGSWCQAGPARPPLRASLLPPTRIVPYAP